MGPAARRDDFYTALWNYLDCTAAVFPVTAVDKARDAPAPPHAFRNAEDEAIYNLCESLNPQSPSLPVAETDGAADR